MPQDDRLKNTKRPETPERVQGFFTSIAENYDTANNAISLGMQYRWKRRAIKEAAPKVGDQCVDVCTGTNDMAVMLAKLIGPEGHVTAVDWNDAMQKAGEPKIAKAGLQDRITNIHGDAEDLPLENDTFDIATVAVASRHLRIPKHFSEMYRVLKPGGRAVVLDLFEPTNPVVRPLYNFYSYKIMPHLGVLLTKDKTDVYNYLPDSIAASVYYKPSDFADEMQKAGFKNVRHFPLSMGVVQIFVGDK